MAYQSRHICRLGITEKQLNQWLFRRQVIPDVPSSGTGTPNEYSLANACQVELFKRLADKGLRRSEASRIAFSPEVKQHFEQQLEWGLNVLLRMRRNIPPDVLMVAMQPTKRKSMIKFVTNESELGRLFPQMAKSARTVVENLGEIAYVVRRLLEAS